MKIIIAAPAWPYRGGIAEFSNRLALTFSREGHEVSIATFKLQYPGFLFPGKTQYTESCAPEGLKIERVLNSVSPFNWIRTGIRFYREKPDILLMRFWLPFMGPCLGTIARVSKMNRHTKVICIFDNVVPHEKRPGDKLLTRYFVNSIDGAIVMANSVGNDLKRFRPFIPVQLNPHPLFDNYGKPVEKEVAARKLNLDPGSKYILFFGFIRAYKGLDLLIEAFSDPKLRNRRIKLVVAGEFYEDDQPYRDLVNKFRLSNEIIFFDRFILDDEVALFFSIADLVVQPYRSATQSGVTQISYYFEKPMLVTDVGGLREIVPDKRCGYVVNPDPGSISEAILDFFENERKESFENCVREEKPRFSWDKMTKAILDCFKKIK
jgi:glycosyltransferase involved in cell wall biosynthesis